MCGIFGYLGAKDAAPILLSGLKQLEYRGYDSAGVALLHPSAGLTVTRTTHRLTDLESKLTELNGHAHGSLLGIGHTRWATHGRASEENAHPHTSLDGKIAVVHNGIFENFRQIRAELQEHGHIPRSETDTECFPMLLSHIMSDGADFADSFGAAVRSMKGKYAIACIHADNPGKILLARSGPPLVVGVSKDEYFIASDVAPLLAYTREVIYLEDGDVAELTKKGLRVFDREGRSAERLPQRVNWDRTATELDGYKHFMHKEIFEQPEAITRTVEAHLRNGTVALELALSDAAKRDIDAISILACGTSWHAGLVAKFLIEQIARIPVDVDYASEYRYRNPIVSKKTMAIGITQSGETADTVAALGEAKTRGAWSLAICNCVGSQVTRLANGVLYTHAGVERGVASTKSFTTQLAILTLLAIDLGRARGTLAADESAKLLAALRELPELVKKAQAVEPHVKAAAVEWHSTPSALYLARGPLYPVALEGALKLKEISYIHAQGYPAGEMKHGPIALIDAQMPVVALLQSDLHSDRMLSNLQEADARGAPIIAVTSEGEHSLDSLADTIIRLPAVHPSLAPILYTIPLQFLAYHMAVLRGCDVDCPRNLAKSVTVE
jgi:glucosamine--fructose-6-phosphate aminotransferase (isomerizing)